MRGCGQKEQEKEEESGDDPQGDTGTMKAGRDQRHPRCTPPPGTDSVEPHSSPGSLPRPRPRPTTASLCGLTAHVLCLGLGLLLCKNAAIWCHHLNNSEALPCGKPSAQVRNHRRSWHLPAPALPLLFLNVSKQPPLVAVVLWRQRHVTGSWGQGHPATEAAIRPTRGILGCVWMGSPDGRHIPAKLLWT